MPLVPLDSPVLITNPTANQWGTINIGDYVSLPAGGITGVLLRIMNTRGEIGAWGLRMDGSLDTRYGYIGAVTMATAMIGCKSNKINIFFQHQYPSSFQFWIEGYTTGGYTFFSEAVDKSPATRGSWQDVDCSVLAPNAVALIFEYLSTDVRGLRKNGSTDNRTGGTGSYQHDIGLGFVGCDENKICEAYISAGSSNSLWLIGYVASSDTTLTMDTNGTAVTLPTAETYGDLEALPASAQMGVYEFTGSALRYFSIRKKGSTFESYACRSLRSTFIIQGNVDRLVEAKVSSLSGSSLYLLGYTTAASAMMGGGIGIGDCLIF
jgi:hypothetical protein